MIRRYDELIRYKTLEERFRYLKLNGAVGRETFGFDRYLNQKFYNSSEWKRFRRDMILRDSGCELGLEPYEISGRVVLHHLNPITPEDLVKRSFSLMDPDNVVCVSKEMHDAIHYGDESFLRKYELITRKPGDTVPWK